MRRFLKKRQTMNYKDNKQEMIKMKAFKLFLERGYDATTMRMLCKEAGVEAPSIYHYFGSKKGLFYAISESFLENYLQLLKESMKYWGPEPMDQLFGFVKFAVWYSMNHIDETKFYLRYRLFWPAELMEDMESHFHKTNDHKENLLRDAIRSCIDSGHCNVNEQTAYQWLINFVDSSTFNIIFSNWRPNEQELKETWVLFYQTRIKMEKGNSQYENQA